MSDYKDNELNYEEIGKRLKKVRGNISQTKFSTPLCCRYEYVKACEHGKKPSLEYLFNVAKFYNVSLEWLITGLVSKDTINDCEKKQAEVIADLDLMKMTEVLKYMLANEDKYNRGWIKRQFEKAFLEEMIEFDEKKQHA
jgi:transcriptional regulator with XRE-family HTH domain